MREQRFIGPTLFMLAGLVVWAAHFTAIYGLNAVVCARGFAAASIIALPVVPLGVTILTLLAVAGLAGPAYLAWVGRHPSMPDGSGPEVARFVRQMTILVSAIAAVGVIWEAVPAFLIPPCS